MWLGWRVWDHTAPLKDSLAISWCRFQLRTLWGENRSETDRRDAYKGKGATDDIKAFEWHNTHGGACGWINNGCVCVAWRALYTHAKTALEILRADHCVCLSAKWHWCYRIPKPCVSQTPLRCGYSSQALFLCQELSLSLTLSLTHSHTHTLSLTHTHSGVFNEDKCRYFCTFLNTLHHMNYCHCTLFFYVLLRKTTVGNDAGNVWNIFKLPCTYLIPDTSHCLFFLSESIIKLSVVINSQRCTVNVLNATGLSLIQYPVKASHSVLLTTGRTVPTHITSVSGCGWTQTHTDTHRHTQTDTHTVSSQEERMAPWRRIPTLRNRNRDVGMLLAAVDHKSLSHAAWHTNTHNNPLLGESMLRGDVMPSISLLTLHNLTGFSHRNSALGPREVSQLSSRSSFRRNLTIHVIIRERNIFNFCRKFSWRLEANTDFSPFF